MSLPHPSILRRVLHARSYLQVALLLLCGCAQSRLAQRLNTPSGKPEITIHRGVVYAQRSCLEWLIKHDYVASGRVDPMAIQMTGTRDVTSSFTSATSKATDIMLVSFNFVQADSSTTTIYMMKSVQHLHGSITIEQLHSLQEMEDQQHSLEEIAIAAGQMR